jgi:hypothetical protein
MYITLENNCKIKYHRNAFSWYIILNTIYKYIRHLYYYHHHNHFIFYLSWQGINVRDLYSVMKLISKIL